MRMLGRFLTVGLLLWGAVASADPNDFKVYQLGSPANRADANANFRIFARELGAALTSVNLSPPETLGHAGFSVNAELSVVSLNTSQFVFPTEAREARPDRAPSGLLLLPSAHVRKGLPFSFELGARAAWIEKSRMGAGTVELKWAVNEGFTYLPDIGLRTFATRLFNTRDFDLAATGFDVGVGKQFAIGGMVTLTPYVGWNLVWVGAWSNQIDFAPEMPKAEWDRQVSPRSGTFTRTVYVYDEVKLLSNSHNRFYGGLRFIGGVIQLGAEVSYSSLGRFRDNGVDRDMPSVLAFNSTVGLDF
jgi:hypothetical protein